LSQATTPLVRHPLAPVGYPDSRAVNCNDEAIPIIGLDATAVEIGFQTVDSFAHVAITGMMWQGLSGSLDYSLGLPVRQMKAYPHVANSKNKGVRVNESSSFLVFVHFCKRYIPFIEKTVGEKNLTAPYRGPVV
jgi:hypothetical protein